MRNGYLMIEKTYKCNQCSRRTVRKDRICQECTDYNEKYYDLRSIEVALIQGDSKSEKYLNQFSSRFGVGSGHSTRKRNGNRYVKFYENSNPC